jgi:hypothetical protein
MRTPVSSDATAALRTKATPFATLLATIAA